MSGGTKVDPAALEGIATRLDGASSGLDGTAGDAPTAVDGGAGEALLLSIVGKLMQDAGTLSSELAGSAGNVRQAGGSYVDTDAAGGDAYAGVPLPEGFR